MVSRTPSSDRHRIQPEAKDDHLPIPGAAGAAFDPMEARGTPAPGAPRRATRKMDLRNLHQFDASAARMNLRIVPLNLNDDLIIGRSSIIRNNGTVEYNQAEKKIEIDLDNVSGQHLSVRRTKKGIFIKDLNSSNKTYVSDKPGRAEDHSLIAEEEYPMIAGEIYNLGTTNIFFELKNDQIFFFRIYDNPPGGARPRDAVRISAQVAIQRPSEERKKQTAGVFTQTPEGFLYVNGAKIALQELIADSTDREAISEYLTFFIKKGAEANSEIFQRAIGLMNQEQLKIAFNLLREFREYQLAIQKLIN